MHIGSRFQKDRREYFSIPEAFFTGFSLPLPDSKTKSRPLVEKHLKGLVQTGPIPRISDPVGLGSVPRICISNKFLGNADAAGHEAML